MTNPSTPETPAPLSFHSPQVQAALKRRMYAYIPLLLSDHSALSKALTHEHEARVSAEQERDAYRSSIEFNASLAASYAKSEVQKAEAERDEAIKAHGVVWNAVRAAAKTFRWLSIPKEANAECAEDAERVFAAEKLTPKWSADWAIISKIDLESLQAKAAAMSGLRVLPNAK